MKNLINRHKGLAIVGLLSLVLFVIIGLIFARMILSSGKTEYGDRLNGLVKIDKKTTDKIKEEIGALENVEDIEIRTQGKIIYITLNVSDNTSKDKGKEIAKSIIPYYEEEVINYYDFSIFINKENTSTKEDENNGYTIAGTKIPNNENISWTKN